MAGPPSRTPKTLEAVRFASPRDALRHIALAARPTPSGPRERARGVVHRAA